MLPPVDMEMVYLESWCVSAHNVGYYCGPVLLQFSITLKQRRLLILFECGLCRQHTGVVQHLRSPCTKV